MLNVIKINDFNILVETEDESLSYASVFYAYGFLTNVYIVNRITNQVKWSINVNELKINGISPSGSDAAVIELNSFIGLSFGSGGSPVPPAPAWGNITGDVTSQTDLVDYISSEGDKKQNKLVGGQNITLVDNPDGTTTVSSEVDTEVFIPVTELPPLEEALLHKIYLLHKGGDTPDESDDKFEEWIVVEIEGIRRWHSFR